MALTTVQLGMQGTPQFYAFKNRLINGQMQIDQRNAGASVTPTADPTYTLDRWAVGLSQASKFSVQQSSSAPSGFSNSLKITSLAATSLGAGDYFTFQQSIEGFNIADLGWGTANAKTVTLSFQVYSSLTGTFGGSIINGSVNRSYPFTYTISSANAWTLISVTVAGDTTGTWATNNTTGIIVMFGLGVGTSGSGAAGAWAGTLYRSATGATSVVGTNGATFYITGVQLEVGSTASSFDYRPYGTELALCQRYYQNSFSNTQPGVSTSLSDAIHLVSWGDGNCSGFPFQTPMRIAPVVTLRAQGSTAAGYVNSGGTDRVAAATNIGVKQVSYITVTSGTANTYNRFTWEATAEL